MASEILGLFTTPQQYQQNQLAQFQNRAAQEIQLNPFQQAALGARTAGYQLGQAVGGALGGTDPQLELITRRQQLASQLNPNDPESYMKIAEIAAQSGDQQFAFAIADAGRKAMSEYALIQQRLRERQGADPFQQIVRTGKYTPASLATYQKSQNVADLVLLEKEGATPAKVQEAETVATSKGFTKGTKEFNDEVVNYLERPEKITPKPSVGSEREGISLELYNKNFYDLTPTERSAVNKKADEESVKKAALTAPKVEVNLNDKTATAKASLDVMTKWEGFLKSGGDVEVANRFKSVQSAVAMANAGNPTADGALLYNIAKMYDPSGAVQEGDKKSITGNPAIPERFKLLVQGVLNGGSFTPTQRKDLEKIANEIVKNRQSQLNIYRKQYVNKATALGGTADDILNPYQGLDRPPLSEFPVKNPRGRQ